MSGVDVGDGVMLSFLVVVVVAPVSGTVPSYGCAVSASAFGVWWIDNVNILVFCAIRAIPSSSQIYACLVDTTTVVGSLRFT